MPQQRRRSNAAEKLKGKWVVLYGIEVYTPYVIDEVMVETYVFPPPTNQELQTIRARRKEVFTEPGKSIHSPRFFFNENYNRKIGKRLDSYN